MFPTPTDFTLELGTLVDLNKRTKYGSRGRNLEAGGMATHADRIRGWFMTWTHRLDCHAIHGIRIGECDVVGPLGEGHSEFKEPDARCRGKVIIRDCVNGTLLSESHPRPRNDLRGSSAWISDVHA